METKKYLPELICSIGITAIYQLKTSTTHTRKLFIGEKIYSWYQQALQERSLSTKQQK